MTPALNFQVVRRFQDYEVGQVLNVSVFSSPHRVAQLVSQRYIAPLSDASMQPTVASLLEASTRKLQTLMRLVEDACVLEAALSQETRTAAQQTLASRLEELHERSAQYHNH